MTEPITSPEPPDAEALRQRLIRNLHDAPRRPFSRAPLERPTPTTS
jgi:hypothetical protein